ncbi:DNA cytosine methyltransferase [bacterium]|nr:DNA cytosine methyltransferase [bacterium]
MAHVISLFSGCGGMDLGFRGGFVFGGRRYARTGFDILAAVDADAEAASLYRLNIGAICRARVEDVAIWPRAGVVIAGPPCQPFSAAGVKQGANDARDAMPVLIEAIGDIAPSAFVIENVPALAERKPFRQAFAELTGALAALGYEIRARVLDAADFGVPQHRRRLFIVGLRPDQACPDPFPAPTHGGALRPFVRVRDAIADLGVPGDRHFAKRDATLRRLAEGERRHPRFGASSRRVFADRPFPTIKASDTAAPRLIHPWFDRALAMPELLRAQSFPDDFIVPRRTPSIGNAVPPVLAWHIARSIARILK